MKISQHQADIPKGEICYGWSNKFPSLYLTMTTLVYCYIYGG